MFLPPSVIPEIFLGNLVALTGAARDGQNAVVGQVHTSLKFPTGYLSIFICVTEAW